jgi:hypothetical protein
MLKTQVEIGTVQALNARQSTVDLYRSTPAFPTACAGLVTVASGFFSNVAILSSFLVVEERNAEMLRRARITSCWENDEA